MDVSRVPVRIRGLVALLVTVLVAGASVAPVQAEPIPGHPDNAPNELSPAQDNAADGHDTCDGEPVAPSGSRVIRRLINGPRQPGTDTLAFTAGVCIYLPPGYMDGTLRYPVLYLLHGASGWQDDWFVQGNAQEILDRVRGNDASKDMIVVTPDGSFNANWRNDANGLLQNETYVFDYVIPYVDKYFRTIPDRRGRAMSGLSNGGAGTLRMAAHNPDYFDVVTAMSAALPVNMAANRSDIYGVNNDPTEVAENLEQVELALVYGLTCGTPAECQAYGVAWGFENACCSNEAYAAKLQVVRQRPFQFERTDGAHSWYFWQRWLEFTHGQFLRQHLADPIPTGAPLPPLDPPGTFSFRSIDKTVDIYGYRFTNDARRAVEFLTLTDVNRDGLTLRGSGTLAAQTAGVYTPGHSYTVSGTGLGNKSVVADSLGRLAFDVNLGPAHTNNEGTSAALLAEASAAGSYWVTRTVGITG